MSAVRFASSDSTPQVSEGDPASPTGEAGEGSVRERIEISGDLDRNAVEALQLEIRRLGRQYAVEIDVRVERVSAEEPGSSV
jgi:hypothetical protein